MKLIRIGTTVINLDRVTYAHAHGYATTVYFGAGEEGRIAFSDEGGIAVAEYLKHEAVDVVAWHERQEKEAAERAEQKAWFAANLALLEHCTNDTGHAWNISPASGYDCIHCGAHDRGPVSQTIDCWGGTWHEGGRA